MLRLRYNTEDWRELLLPLIDEYDPEGVTEATEFDDTADDLCCAVLNMLAEKGIDHERAYQQSRGSFVIVQGGPQVEIAIFDDCVSRALDSFVSRVQKIIDIAKSAV